MPKFENVKKVEIIESRWWIGIMITDSEDVEHDFVASADAYYTDRDGIWFGTRQEYNDYDN